MTEPLETRVKRLRIRCWRRGTKEMDLLLGAYADSALTSLEPEALDAFEAMLEENDQDLYVWFSRQAPEPAAHRATLARLRAFHGIA
ncbi:MAG: succinate dehydrogenase assembly factor 2 [Pseudomonadota bacterium]